MNDLDIIIKMERLNKIYENNKRTILISSAVFASAAIAYYALKRHNHFNPLTPRAPHKDWNHDPHFSQPNIPLHYKNTLSRDKMLSEI